MIKNPEKMDYPIVSEEGDIVEGGHLFDPEKPGHYREAVLRTFARQPKKMDLKVAEKIKKHLDVCMRNPRTGRPGCKEIYDEYALEQQTLLDDVN